MTERPWRLDFVRGHRVETYARRERAVDRALLFAHRLATVTQVIVSHRADGTVRYLCTVVFDRAKHSARVESAHSTSPSDADRVREQIRNDRGTDDRPPWTLETADPEAGPSRGSSARHS